TELLGNTTDAYINGSQVHAGRDVEVSALTREQVLSAAAGLGLGGSAGLARGVSAIHLTRTTQASINGHSTINAGGDLSVTADDGARLTLGVGTLAGGGGAAGGAIAVGLAGDTTSAQIADSTTNASGNTLVSATSKENLTTTAVGAAGGALAL